LVRIETSLEIYFERTTKGAARVLDSPNPAPMEIRLLLRKYRADELTDEREYQQLLDWLQQMIRDSAAPKSERGAALDLLAGIEARSELKARH
jgi:hypothetical protein